MLQPKLKSSTALVILCATALGGFAPECRGQDDTEFYVKRNASTWGRKIVTKYYDGGIDIETKVLEWAYSKEKKILWAKLGITFNGLFGGPYSVAGEYEEMGGGWTWKSTSMNAALKEWLITKGVIEVIGDATKRRAEERTKKQKEHDFKLLGSTQEAERKRVDAERRGKPGTVLASNLSPQPTQYYTQYNVGNETFRFMQSTIPMTPQPGKSTPSLATVNDRGKTLTAPFHFAGDPYFRALLENNTLLVLKYRCTSRNTRGYALIYRTPGGNFFYTLNDWKEWKPLSEGQRKVYTWTVTDKVKVTITFARPNVNEDSKGRQVDYRFQYTQVASR